MLKWYKDDVTGQRVKIDKEARVAIDTSRDK